MPVALAEPGLVQDVALAVDPSQAGHAKTDARTIRQASGQSQKSRSARDQEDNPAKEPPTVGKPVIIDPPDEAKPTIKDPGKRKPE